MKGKQIHRDGERRNYGRKRREREKERGEDKQRGETECDSGLLNR